jgi:D-threonate/D-erythronate kinase
MTGGQDERYPSPRSVTSVEPRLVILADDLTGACDAAVAFTTVCDPVRVQLNSESPEPNGVQATTTESRDLPAAYAEVRIRSIVERLPSNIELCKKIDSVFRGNTLAEIAATLRCARYDLAILAPSYPALGRTVRAGILHICDVGGDRTLPIAELLAQSGCSFTILPAGLSPDAVTSTMRRCLSDSTPAILCDASNQHDLERVVRSARSLGKRILWIGSGGLAHALAADFPALKPTSALQPRPGRTIFFIGSPHPVTCTQVEHLRRTGRITEYPSGATPSPATDWLIPVMLGETTDDDIRAIAGQNPTQIGCLFMTGGDTAHVICRALGIHALRLHREFAPGVPLATAEGGPFDGVSVVLKSGGFGEPDLLCRLLETCRPEVPA